MVSFTQNIQGHIVHTYHLVYNNAGQRCVDTANKIKDFVQRHQGEILFIGCCAITAYFAPHLFFPALIVTVIIRVELKQLAKQYLRDEQNPYERNPRFGPHYVSVLDLTLGVIAAADAFALGTIFIAGSWTVALIPVLGGVAAGNCLAKMGMDIAHSWSSLQG